MRAGILTFPNSPSYGASLQMYGLYSALEKMGCEAEIINYRNTYMTEKKHVKYHSNSVLKNVVISVFDIPFKRKFINFENQLVFFPKRILTEDDDLSVISSRFDYLICGSDQVWNPDITGKDLHYFFDFCCNDEKKVSYAASFGVERIDDDYSDAVKAQLEKFKAVSVRELEGQKIVNSLINQECNIVLDPSMLLTKEEWREQEKKIKRVPDKYIARFIFNQSDEVEKTIDELSKRTGLPVVTIGGTVFSRLKNRYFTGPIGPKEWLYVLDNAEYVVTDSFHGAAFSIIFQKQVYVSLASSTNSRLKTLLNTFELNNRVVSSDLGCDAIDYIKVQGIMEEMRNQSFMFLKKAMGIE